MEEPGPGDKAPPPGEEEVPPEGTFWPPCPPCPGLTPTRTVVATRATGWIEMEAEGPLSFTSEPPDAPGLPFPGLVFPPELPGTVAEPELPGPGLDVPEF